jgi:hypothetical protein
MVYVRHTSNSNTTIMVADKVTKLLWMGSSIGMSELSLAINA